jgi:hypothetical protein
LGGLIPNPAQNDPNSILEEAVMNAILEDQPALDVEPGWIKVMESGAGKFTQHLLDGRHRLLADEWVEVGGNDRGPGPYELLLMALAPARR